MASATFSIRPCVESDALTMAYSLRLIEDRLAPSAGWETVLSAANRILYVATGEVMFGPEGPRGGRVAADQAWWGPDAISGLAGTEGAHILRFELVRQPPPPAAGGTVVLEHPIRLDGEAGWLMRCDRVDFAPGGVALPHRHRGGGIRRLLRGGLEVTVGGEEAPADATRRRVVRKRPRAGAGRGRTRRRHELPARRGAPARGPRLELDHVRRSWRRRAQQAPSICRRRFGGDLDGPLQASPSRSPSRASPRRVDLASSAL